MLYNSLRCQKISLEVLVTLGNGHYRMLRKQSFNHMIAKWANSDITDVKNRMIDYKTVMC